MLSLTINPVVSAMHFFLAGSVVIRLSSSRPSVVHTCNTNASSEACSLTSLSLSRSLSLSLSLALSLSLVKNASANAALLLSQTNVACRSPLTAQLRLHYALNIKVLLDTLRAWRTPQQHYGMAALVLNVVIATRTHGHGHVSTHVRWLYNLIRVANATAVFDGFFWEHAARWTRQR